MNDKIVNKDGKQYVEKHCPHCGNTLLLGMHEEERRIHFACAKCGHQLEAVVPAKQANVCECGTVLEDGDVFCPGCGKRIEKATSPAPTAKAEAKQEATAANGQQKFKLDVPKYQFIPTMGGFVLFMIGMMCITFSVDGRSVNWGAMGSGFGFCGLCAIMCGVLAILAFTKKWKKLVLWMNVVLAALSVIFIIMGAVMFA